MATRTIQPQGILPRQSDAKNSTQHLSNSLEMRHLPSTLPAATKGAVFLPALERLCSSKNTVQLTPHAAETWVAALSIYASRPDVVNTAVVRLAVSEDPFPDLGKLLIECEKVRRAIDGTVPQDAKAIKFDNVKALAEAWGLDT